MRRLLVIAAFALSGCGGDPVSEIFACYSVEPSLATAGGALRVCATAEPDGRVLFGCDGSSIGTLDSGPHSQGFVQRRADGIALELTAELPAGTTIVERARVTFQPDRIVDVSLQIDPSCGPRVCGAGETCAGGACIDEQVQASCLADHGREPPRGCSDPRVIPGCRTASPDGG